MFKSQFFCVHAYRQCLILKVLLILMPFVDSLALLFAPLWVLALFLIVHVAVVVLWIRAKLQLLDAFIFDLLE